MIRTMETKDSVGNVLNNGDTVVVSKTLKVKGMSKTLKRGDKIKSATSKKHLLISDLFINNKFNFKKKAV